MIDEFFGHWPNPRRSVYLNQWGYTEVYRRGRSSIAEIEKQFDQNGKCAGKVPEMWKFIENWGWGPQSKVKS